MDTARDPFGPPTRMGPYELLFRIAAGGMAEVYAARVHGEAGFEKLVAVKRMLPTLADDEEFVTMFLDEARVAANISSPHVVQTLDLGRDHEGALYIAMELVVGVTLSRIMKEAAKVRRAVPVAMSIELLAQSALGLSAAHEATTPIGQPLDIVHRDVSPQNILVGVDGRARLTDFGVARAVLRSTQTQAGRIKGKFAYSAPEQLRSEKIDQRADIFALGVVAWEALAGQRLFVADHPLATMERVANMPILPLDQVRSRVPRNVAEVVDRALQRDPDQRFATAHDFATELRRAGQEAGLSLPNQGEVSRFVKAAGGEPLKKMRSNIRKALSGGPSAVLPSTDEQPTIISTTGTNDTDVLDAAGVSAPEPDASGVARIPGSLLPGAIAVPPPAAPADDGRRKKVAAVVIATALVGGVLAVVLAGSSDETPVPANQGADAQEELPNDAPEVQPVAPAAPVDVPDEPDPLDERDDEGVSFALDELDDAPQVHAPTNMRTRRTAPSRMGARTASRSSEPEPTPERAPEPERQRAPEPTPERAPEPEPERAPEPESTPRSEMAPSSPMSPLVGIEAFDRDMNRD